MANIKISQLPAKGANLAADDLLEVSEFTGTGYVSKSITGQEIIDAASGGGAAWGSITGTISSQTDLNTALSGKQATLVSGTNIKTINSTSLLGSGNVAVQATLVSGTNIKTINGASVLGSGNIATAALNPTSTYFPYNNGGVFADSQLRQYLVGPWNYFSANNLAGISFVDAFSDSIASLNGTFGNTTIGPNGYQIGNSVFDSAFQVGSFLTQTGTHTTISRWLKTVDENGTTYYIPLYL